MRTCTVLTFATILGLVVSIGDQFVGLLVRANDRVSCSQRMKPIESMPGGPQNKTNALRIIGNRGKTQKASTA